ncbi:MAG: class I SAM-dependent rRNA methyltransferase [Anaerolineaceae bacterium]|nr:class I SAM-dependent rRNA methyltransferase [Anaerolineaceae bacterium]
MEIIIAKEKIKSLQQRHPWIFERSIKTVKGTPENGSVVRVLDEEGQAYGWASFSAHSAIRARVLSWNPQITIDAQWIHDQLSQAIKHRETMLDDKNNACRLVHGESDFFPGLIVDRYADQLVAQFLTSGSEFWKKEITDALIQISGVKNVYERSDVDVRKLEGLQPVKGVLAGSKPEKYIRILEHGLAFDVDVANGQKTGFFLDQRNNRKRIQTYTQGKRVLNAFCYSGGFTAYALQAGAEQVISIDSSADAIELGRNNMRINALADQEADWITGDVFHYLRRCRDSREQFDVIILDPPKFAPTIHQVQQAARGYKDINLLAFKLLKPGGTLFSFSCSGGVDKVLFRKILAGAAADAKVDVQILGSMEQSQDHPVGLAFPEGAYLKGLICRVI